MILAKKRFNSEMEQDFPAGGPRFIAQQGQYMASGHQMIKPLSNAGIQHGLIMDVLTIALRIHPNRFIQVHGKGGILQ